ncbi:IS30 family transposase [Arthrobacter sp. SORGH_AS 212]|nr:IS30 family transposase [Arthrobacter sp. SORGH_AS_0212]
MHETIYRALYGLSIRPVPSGSARLLRSGEYSRRPRSRTKVKPRQYITDALKIGDRPAHIATRAEAGHWEGDLVMGKANKTAIVTLVERSSRFLIAFALPAGNRSEVTRDQLIEVLPATLRRTLAWDRGSEMAKHAEVTAATGALVYFCDPASPWQRAPNENANGLLRQYFHKGADLGALAEGEVRFAADGIEQSSAGGSGLGQRRGRVRLTRGRGAGPAVSAILRFLRRYSGGAAGMSFPG